jgi:flagellar FliL protein
MKKLLILLVLLLLLGGGGAAAWWFYLRPPEEGAEAVIEEAPPPVLTQIPLGPFGISVVKDSSAKRTIWFVMNLTFDDPEKQAWADEHMPAIQDAIVTELHGLLPRKMVEQGGYDANLIRARLRKALTQKFGDGRFYDLTITNMEIRDQE